MRKTISLISCLLLIIIFSCKNDNDDGESLISSDFLFQYSTKNRFMNKEYIGEVTYDELKSYGDFGLGTFNEINGEMICLDGVFYRIDASGRVENANLNEKSPYAVLKFFKTDQKTKFNGYKSLESIKSEISNFISDTSRPIAIKIFGKFRYVKTRSVHKQKPPYQSLDQIVKNQVISEYHNSTGTLVGFWFPEYFEGVNFSQFHFHFITKDKSGGGHLLDCEAEDIIIELDYPVEIIVKI
ncbi:acetolactate decarboxylase [Bacteroidota bacterium]